MPASKQRQEHLRRLMESLAPKPVHYTAAMVAALSLYDRGLIGPARRVAGSEAILLEWVGWREREQPPPDPAASDEEPADPDDDA